MFVHEEINTNVLQFETTVHKCVFCRDNLYRVELDNMAGDEMFYSKVRTDTKESRATSNRALNAELSSRNGPGSPTRMTFGCVG